ncbi:MULTISPECIES: alpha/beta hydrolase [unclassified Paenibacillus]|uniref:alpha/beta hydrolase n=1 Tax=unclassified Paenibacillus TaxID=185978 RepID=UPI002F40B93E
MKHIFKQGSSKDAPVLLLLHGTGGNEHDLLGLAELISPQSSVLSVRGNVLENGMPRFFRRLSEGVFDLEDLLYRTQELNSFLEEAAAQYSFDRSNMVAVGYSNGANIAASMLFIYKDALRGAVLHHPMVPLRDRILPDMTSLPVFIGAGDNDPICTPKETKDLTQLLENAGASVHVHWESAGHRLTQTEVQAAAAWFEKQFAETK